jgi:hypothetical protein
VRVCSHCIHVIDKVQEYSNTTMAACWDAVRSLTGLKKVTKLLQQALNTIVCTILGTVKHPIRMCQSCSVAEAKHWHRMAAVFHCCSRH